MLTTEYLHGLALGFTDGSLYRLSLIDKSYRVVFDQMASKLIYFLGKPLSS